MANDEVMDWFGGDLDERIVGLFGTDPWTAVAELSLATAQDELLEGQLVDLLQASLDTGADETVGTAALALVLGEVRSRDAVGPLILALAAPDEMLVAAAVRALQRIGEPTLEPLIDLLDSPELDDDVAQSVVESLEGIRLHDLPDQEALVESRLLRELLEPEKRARRREAAGLALARLGVTRAGEVIESILEVEFPSGNAFLEEALEIMAEHPDGLPSPAALPWQEDVRWADGTVLPGGDLEKLEEENGYTPPGMRS